jgi:hypothetical protein
MQPDNDIGLAFAKLAFSAELIGLRTFDEGVDRGGRNLLEAQSAKIVLDLRFLNILPVVTPLRRNALGGK